MGGKAEKPLPTQSHMLYASAPHKTCFKELPVYGLRNGGRAPGRCKSEWSGKRNIEFINVFT